MQKEIKGRLKSRHFDFAAKTIHTANVQPAAKHARDAAKAVTAILCRARDVRAIRPDDMEGDITVSVEANGACEDINAIGHEINFTQ